MTKKYCMKRKEDFIVGETAEDYCVDCQYFDSGECWAADLPVEYVENEPIHIVRPTAEILQFPKRGKLNE